MTDRPSSPGSQNNPGWENARWSGSGTQQSGAQASPGSRDGLPPPRPAYREQHDDNALNRFLGGSPLSVLIRLLVVSLVVGALLMWLDIRPMDIYFGLRRFLQRIWMLGFDSLREIGAYIIAGAVIVVPVWFVLRLMNMRGK
jgi:hypothetical protein